MSTTTYGRTAPVREHLLRPQGLAGEIRDLRADTEKSTGSGVQYVNITATTPLESLTTTGLSIVRNSAPAGATVAVILPDATDGCVKEVVNGVNGQGTSATIHVQCSNNLSDNFYILSEGASLRLVFVSALDGWVATNYCANVNANWD